MKQFILLLEFIAWARRLAKHSESFELSKEAIAS